MIMQPLSIDPSRSAAAGMDREQAAEQMESVFLSLLVKEMRQSLPEGLFGGGPGAAVYEGLFDEHLGQQLCEGGGTGLREAILQTMAGDEMKEPAKC
ncbi:MAG: hypothetical protein EXS14_10460 [Planctomycetes bacterium]|nr:hypothetical protein [Planctomycetota bacterium]